MKRRLLVIVFFVAFALLTTHAAHAQEVWSLVSTQVNPNNERTAYYGGGTTPYWYTEPRYEGKLREYTLSSTSFSMHDVEVDHGFVYYDVILTTNFQSPSSQLTPGQTVNLTANCSHSGVVDSFPPGVEFYYGGDVSMPPPTTFGYYPWHQNFTGVSSTTYSFVVPNTHSGELKITAVWRNHACAYVVWTYQASGTPAGNNSPQLSMASLTPTTGTSETEFTFSVKYYDADGDSPSVNQLIINNQSYFYPALSSGSASNGTYSQTLLNFPSGTNHYYFYFEDGNGGTARLPTTGYYSGPIIFQSPQPCPLEQITQNNRTLDPLREFRYRVLSQSERGRDYVNLYYDHAHEAALILVRNPELRQQARRILQEAVPEIRLVLRDEKNELSPALKEQVLSFLDEFEGYTSEGLVEAVSVVREDIGTGILEELIADMDFSPRPTH